MMKNLKMLQPIALTKRILQYIGLCWMTLIGVELYAFFGLLATETDKILVFVYLIPHYIFGTIFLKAKWLFKLIVPLVTSIVSFGCFLLIDSKNTTNYEVLVYSGISIIFVWEIAYQL